jgi:glycosyltransferase involved in cell wall biosynthesis
MSKTIAAIILTKNEEIHLERCINSIKDVVDDIVVVDSYSTDDTIDIARRMGARVFQNPWKNYATQFNYGLYECGIKTDWVWRIDADEFLEGNLGENVKYAINSCDDDITRIYVNKRIDFMGKPLFHGGWYPSYHLKVWKRGHGECENRWMDEHIKLLDGRSIVVKDGNQVDSNLNDLTWWIEKHNGYATREMVDMLMMEYNMDAKARVVVPKFWGSEEQRKRWLKIKYVKSPLFVRPFVNFFIRYFFKGGFLDGRHGFMWHVLQGFWYRYLVDSKIYELKKRFNFDDEKIKQYLREKYSL